MPNIVVTTPSTKTTSASYLIQQPPFATRIRTLYAPFSNGGSASIQRGWMEWDSNIAWPKPYSSNPSQAGAPKVLFLYNPSTIQASYQITDSTATAALIYPVTAVQPILRVPLQQQVGFTIMFDRTYELTNNPNEQMSTLGVELDVLAMKQFTGMFASLYTNDGGNDPVLDSAGNPIAGGATINPVYNSTGINQGIMQLTLAYVFFANGVSGLSYYGYVDSWDVSYTHFTQDMVPVRAVVDVSFTLLPPPSQAIPGGVGTTAATQYAAYTVTPGGLVGRGG